MAIDGETANSGALVAAPRYTLTVRTSDFCVIVTDTGPRHPWACGLATTHATCTAMRARTQSARTSTRTRTRAHARAAHSHVRACTHAHTQASLKWDQWKRHTPLLYDMLINNNLTHPSPCVHWGHRVSDDAERSTQVCPPVCTACLPAGRRSCVLPAVQSWQNVCWRGIEK